ncbi:MAG: TetR/AcrR family transcriptional regulator [Sporocytophaga sp.]|nr:TetR/AcrR family transcriptional regulator [Sporocytophaga sp.]
MNSTKESIVNIADDLIRRRGYNAFSYNDISKVLAVKNAAIHYHFPTKSDLGVAVIDLHIQKIDHFIKGVAPLSEPEKVEAFLNIYEQIQINKKVCLVGTLATDWDTIDDKIQQKLIVFVNIVGDWLTGVMEEGLKKGSLTFNGDPQTRAMLIITSIMAAAQMAKIMGPASFQSVKNAIINEVNRQ